MHTFFDGSPERVVAALLGDASTMSEEQLDRIALLVEQAREDGR
jgi:hypothetical protein